MFFSELKIPLGENPTTPNSNILIWEQGYVIYVTPNTLYLISDSDLAMATEYVPNEQVRHALARYLSQLTLVDETGSGILQLPENIPEGFHLTHKRLCERTLFKTKSGFAIILSKEREWRNVTEREGNREVVSTFPS